MKSIKKIAVFFVSTLLIISTFASARPVLTQSAFPEIRGVWLTKNDTEVLLDRDRLASTLTELAQVNFNTIYPVVWNSGYVSYPSPVARQAGIQPFEKRGFQNQDVLAELVHRGHENGLLVIPWFEFGFMAPPSSELAVKHSQWLTNRRDGSKIGNSAAGQVVWLNPFHPQVQKFITDLVLEICTRYRVDGIQFDDQMSLPVDFGYDAYTKALYKKETKLDAPANPKDKRWVKWRADKLTAFMTNLNRAVKEQKPNLIFSVAPNPYSTAYNSYLQDWKAWIAKDIVDELIVQIYRPNLGGFIKELNRPEIKFARSKIPTGVGVLTGLRNNPTSIYLIENKVRQARKYGLGISFFYYETLWQNTTEDNELRKSVVSALFYDPQSRI